MALLIKRYLFYLDKRLKTEKVDKSKSIDQVEIKALTVGVFWNLVMAAAGWVTYYLSGSEAMLFDGNFSIVAAAATWVSVIISRIKHDRSRTYPLGYYAYESLFVFLKGLLLAGIILMAFVQNSVRIINYLNGEDIPSIETGPILIYAFSMIVIAIGLAVYFRRAYLRTEKTSPMLRLESKTAIADGFLSLGVGLAFLFISLVQPGSKIEFLIYIGDAIIVVALCFLLFKVPLSEIRHAVRNLAGGTLTDKAEVEKILQITKNGLTEKLKFLGGYFNQTGSSYAGLVFAKPIDGSIETAVLDDIRESIFNNLGESYPFTDFEIVVTDVDDWKGREFLSQ